MDDVNIKKRIAAAPSQIWALWSNVAESPIWDTDVLYCQLDGPFQKGTLGICKLKSGITMNIKLEEVMPENSYINSGKIFGISILFSHTMIRQSDNEMIVTHSAKITGHLSFIYRPLLRTLLKGAMKTALDNFAVLAEKQSEKTARKNRARKNQTLAKKPT